MSERIVEFEKHLAAVNAHEPTVRALVGWDESAARTRANGAGDGPLSGWAVGVKDIIDVAGLATRCGSDLTPDAPAVRDAAVVDRLRFLGAYVFSKVVTTVFAFLDPGPTTNPWNPAHTPGGSSMGSAAAVAAGMVRLALGSQTIASVNRPASFCGVVGLKPTYERVSREGLVPFSPSVHTIGFFTVDVADMEAACSAYFGEPPAKTTAPLRVGVLEDMLCEPAEADMQAAIRGAGEKLRSAGLDVRPAQLPEVLWGAYENHLTLISAEAAAAHDELFRRSGERYSPKLRELILKGQAIPPDRVHACLEKRSQLQAELDRLFDDFDVLLTPSATGAPPKGLGSTGDPRMSLIVTHTGVPSLTLPAELSPSGLPLGIQLVARTMRDMALLAAGAQIERVLGFDACPFR